MIVSNGLTFFGIRKDDPAINGGQIIAHGTPEDVMQESASYTGHYLQEVLKQHTGV